MNRGCRASSPSAWRMPFTTTARVDSETKVCGQTTSRIWARESARGRRSSEQAQQLVGLRLQGDGLARAKELASLLVELEVPEPERHDRPGRRQEKPSAVWVLHEG